MRTVAFALIGLVAIAFIIVQVKATVHVNADLNVSGLATMKLVQAR